MADAILAASGVYAIKNKANGKAYVGSSAHIKHRFRHHLSCLNNGKHANQKLQRAWNKYGAESFEMVAIEHVADISLCVVREQHWIDRLDAVRSGYNIRLVAESNRGLKHSADIKAKMSARMVGNKYSLGVYPSVETRALLSAKRKGATVTQETRAKLSNTRLGMKYSDETKERIAAAKRGLVASEKTRAKMSKSHTGKVFSDERRANISAALKGRSLSEECRRKLSLANKGQGAGRVFSQETRDKLSAAAKARELAKRLAKSAVDEEGQALGVI